MYKWGAGPNCASRGISKAHCAAALTVTAGDVIMRKLDAWSDPDRSQPVVLWRAEVHDQQTGTTAEVAGHVEVRWSHGRFAQAPEAKVYLGTAHHAVPGYVPLSRPERDPERLALGWSGGP